MNFSFSTKDTMHFKMNFAGASGSSGGIQGNGVGAISVMSEEAYQALSERDSQTLYIVQTAESVLLYFGSVPLRLNDDTLVRSSSVDYIEQMTQAAYDELDAPDERTLYALT